MIGFLDCDGSQWSVSTIVDVADLKVTEESA